MKRNVLILAAALILPACGSTGETARTDHDRMQGTWTVLSWETGGERYPAEKFNNLRVEIAGDRFVFHEGKTTWEMEFKLNPGSNPKSIDLTPPDGPANPGIYELEGDTLKVCFNKGQERPKDFTTSAEGERTSFVLKREKSGTKS
jgi:uncharacterized protein (TIGR03067 family)